MKLVTGMVASLVIGTLSFGAFAAKEIQKEDVAKMNLTKVGSITTSGRRRRWMPDVICRKKPMSWVGNTLW